MVQVLELLWLAKSASQAETTSNRKEKRSVALVGLRQICQHNKKYNRLEYYAGTMLA